LVKCIHKGQTTGSMTEVIANELRCTEISFVAPQSMRMHKCYRVHMTIKAKRNTVYNRSERMYFAFTHQCHIASVIT